MIVWVKEFGESFTKRTVMPVKPVEKHVACRQELCKA